MKIIFSPEYSGHVYARPENGTVMMDTMVANTIGLLEVLELRLGLHYETASQQQNLARYYDAMTRYMQSHPGNCLEDSFRVSGLKTAQAVMAWRNELRSAGWDGQGAESSERLEAMAEIEKIHHADSDKDLKDRVDTIMEQLQAQQLDCSNMELVLNCDPTWLRPLENSLLCALQQRGAQVSILPTAKGDKTNLDIVRRMMTDKDFNPLELNSNDESILIYQFSDRQQANEYLASANLCDADVCIDSHSKALDHQLKLMGYPQAGSISHDSAPQLTQLLVVGVSLFHPTLNVNTLLQWLDMPLHPLDRSIRFRLANAIASDGGYRNAACQEIIDKYIQGEYVYLTDEQRELPEDEQKILRRKKMNDRKKKVELFLPPMTPVADISRTSLKEFTLALATWCRQKNMLDNTSDEDILWREQLSKVIDMAETFVLLLNTVSTPTLDSKTVESWLSALDKTGDFTGSRDQKGCPIVVSNPADIISVADKTLWAGFNGEDSTRAECSFLSPSEKESLAGGGHVRLWGDNEGRYMDYQALMPLLHTSNQLILVVCERNDGKAEAKHPLLIRLEQQFNKEGGEKKLDTIIRQPEIDPSLLTPVVKVRNERATGELEFDHADKLKWPGHLSPTYIRTLVDDPFSYMMDQLLKIQPDAKVSMRDLRTTSGTVAHAVIETLFSPAEGSRTKSAEAIEADIEEQYETVFDQTVEACGAIFLLSENLLEKETLRVKLRRNLDTLCDIIKNNNLHVLSCETPVKSMVGFGLPEETDKASGKVFDAKGIIDMILEDSEGHPVIFDFKWSYSPRYYRDMLENNDSIQLEFYRRMLQDERRNTVSKVAYFIMPGSDGRLYSLDHFEGRNCTQVKTDDDTNVVEEIVGLVKETKEILDSGKVDASIIGTFSNYQMFVELTESDNQ